MDPASGKTVILYSTTTTNFLVAPKCSHLLLK
jgi:hypothetical protein